MMRLLRDSAAATDDDWRTLGTLPSASICANVGQGEYPTPLRGIKFAAFWTNDAGTFLPGGGSLTLTLVEVVKLGSVHAVAIGQSIVATAGTLYTFDGLTAGLFTMRLSAVTAITNATRYRILWDTY